MTDSVPEASSKPPPNRLAISHLMLWTLGSGVVLAFHRLQEVPTSGTPPGIQIAISSFAIFNSLPSGAAVGSLALWAYRRCRGRVGFPTQPGHWLLLASGLLTVLFSCQFAVGMLLEHPLEELAFLRKWDVDLFRLSLFLGPSSVAGAAFYSVGLWSMRDESRLWNAAIGSLIVQFAGGYLLAAAGLVWAVFSGSGDSEMPFIIAFQCGFVVFGLISTVMIAWAAITDPRRRDRDFIHWTGIVAAFASIVLNFATMLVFFLLQR